jgi:hypothetical protein
VRLGYDLRGIMYWSLVSLIENRGRPKGRLLLIFNSWTESISI